MRSCLSFSVSCEYLQECAIYSGRLLFPSSSTQSALNPETSLSCIDVYLPLFSPPPPFSIASFISQCLSTHTRLLLTEPQSVLVQEFDCSGGVPVFCVKVASSSDVDDWSLSGIWLDLRYGRWRWKGRRDANFIGTTCNRNVCGVFKVFTNFPFFIIYLYTIYIFFSFKVCGLFEEPSYESVWAAKMLWTEFGFFFGTLLTDIVFLLVYCSLLCFSGFLISALPAPVCLPIAWPRACFFTLPSPTDFYTFAGCFIKELYTVCASSLLWWSWQYSVVSIYQV